MYMYMCTRTCSTIAVHWLTLGAHAQEGYCSRHCQSVCLLSHISPLEHLFVLKILSRTQRATEVKKFVCFSLKPLRSRNPALLPLKAIRSVGHFPAGCTHAHYRVNGHEYPETWWRRGFCTLVHSSFFNSWVSYTSIHSWATFVYLYMSCT